MPTVTIEIIEKDGTKITCYAKGFFLMWLNFTNDPRPRIKKWIKEYEAKK